MIRNLWLLKKKTILLGNFLILDKAFSLNEFCSFWAQSIFMNKESIDRNVVLKLAFDFALLIMGFCEKLEAERKYIIARQLLKSGTSIGANAIEGQNAESTADFIHKFKIAAKEGEETEYWLLLCKYSSGYPETKELLSKIGELNKVIGKIISSSRRKKRFNSIFFGLLAQGI